MFKNSFQNSIPQIFVFTTYLPVTMGAQLGVPYGHMDCRQFGVQFGYLDVYDLPFCVPYDVVLLLDVPVVLFSVPYDVVLLLDVPMDLCTQLYSPVQCTMYSTWLSMYLKYQTWPINPIFWFYHKAEVNSGGGLWKDQTWPKNSIFGFYKKAMINSGGGLEKYQTWPINSILGFIAKQRSILAVDFGFSANVVNARKRSIAVEIWRDTFLLLCFFPLIIQ